MVRHLVDARLVLSRLNIMFYGLIRRAATLLISAANYLRSPLLLAIRIYFFWQLYLAGKGKLGNMEKVIQFFTSLGIPLPAFNAWLVASLECFGGLLLVVGLFSRPLAFMVFISMTVAYISADMEAFSSIFSDSDKFVKADPFVYWFASLIIIAFGPGLFSLDTVAGRLLNKRGMTGGSRNAK
jgi:putative oxidoreductase